MTTYTDNPFRGPNPLTEGDPIFGRDRDLRLIRDQLLSDRLLLLHSTSGCGKTSLVEAGLRPMLEKTLTLEKTVSLKRTEGEKERSLLDRLPAYVNLGPVAIVPQAKPTGARAKEIEEFKFLFFDQFEEVLADKTMDEGDRVEFFKRLGLLLEPRNIWAIFAIREDYLGDLQPYLRYLPNQLQSRYRLTQFSLAEATTAIQMKKTSREANGTELVRIAFTESAARDLAENLARSPVSGAAVKIVEPVHLQVVCAYLWGKMEHPIARLPPDKELKENLLSVTAALADYYSTTLKSLAKADEDLEDRLRTWFDSKLIDKKQEQRLRVRYSPESTGIKADQLSYLKDKYLIRDDQPSGPTPDRVVELAHDRLIVPIMQDNNIWFSAFAQPWREAATEYQLSPSPRLLLHGASLREALKWARRNPGKLGPEHRTFLEASVRQRFVGYVTAAAGMATCLAIVMIVFMVGAILQSRDKVAIAKQVTAQSVKELADAKTQSAKDIAHANAQSAKELAFATAQSVKDIDAAKAQSAKDIAAAKYQSAKDIAAAKAQSAKDIAAAKAQSAKDIAAAKAQSAKDIAAAKAQSAKDIAAAKAQSAKDIAAAKAQSAKDITDAKHIGNSLGAIGDAKEQQSLGLALTALSEATLSGKGAFENNGDSKNLIQRALKVTADLMSRSLLEKTICLGGYAQSFAVIDPQSTLVAVDQSGRYYSEEKPLDCPIEASPSANAIVPYPTASAVAKGANITAVSNHGGSITLRDASKGPISMGLGQQISALTLSNDGRYVGATSVLWSVGVWRIKDSEASRVLQWPGSIQNPLSWLRWLNIFRTSSDQMTNVLAMHVDEGLPGKGPKGFLVEGREDGCARIAPVYMDRFRSTEPLKSLGCDTSRPVVSIALSQDGTLLATGTRQGQITLWDLSGSPESWKSKDFGDSYVTLADSQNKDPIYKGCGSSVTSLTFMTKTDWNLLAAGCQDGSIHVFDISHPKFGNSNNFKYHEVIKPPLKAIVGGVTLLSFDGTNGRLYSAGDSRRVEVWKIPSRQQNDTLTVIRKELDSLADEVVLPTDVQEIDKRIGKVIRDICNSSDSLTSFGACKLN